MNAADIMTREVVTVRPDTSVSAVAHLLRDKKISSVPVVDDHDHVVGIISEGDLLGRPPSRSPRGWWLRLFDDETVCLEEIATARHLKARDVMTRDVVSILDQAPIDLLATLMRRHKAEGVPIVRDGKLVGIVSRADLLDALVGDREEIAGTRSAN
jgi:CBS domain-containing protein